MVFLPWSGGRGVAGVRNRAELAKCEEAIRPGEGAARRWGVRGEAGDSRAADKKTAPRGGREGVLIFLPRQRAACLLRPCRACARFRRWPRMPGHALTKGKRACRNLAGQRAKADRDAGAACCRVSPLGSRCPKGKGFSATCSSSRGNPSSGARRHLLPKGRREMERRPCRKADEGRLREWRRLIILPGAIPRRPPLDFRPQQG